jgi:hypothetical protein
LAENKNEMRRYDRKIRGIFGKKEVRIVKLKIKIKIIRREGGKLKKKKTGDGRER